MTEFNNNVQTDVIVSFRESIDNINKFAQEMAGLDARFGALDQRIDAFKASLQSMSQAAATALAFPAKGGVNRLRQHIDREVAGILGSATPAIDSSTARALRDKLDKEINSYVRAVGKNLRLHVDASGVGNGKIPLNNDEFDRLNRTLAALINAQIKNVTSALRKYGAGMIDDSVIKAVRFQLEASTIQSIVNKIKHHVVRSIVNPEIDSAPVRLTFTERDLSKMVGRIKTQLKQSIDVDVTGFNTSTSKDLMAKMRDVTNKVDKVFSDYVRGLVAGINQPSARTEVPIKSIEKRLKQALAKELNVSIQELESQLKTISLGDLSALRLREDFRRLGNAINTKLNKGLKTEIDDIIKQVEQTQISYTPRLKHHLINQLNRINNALVKKVREQIDLQIQNILNEINSSHAAPRNLGRRRQIVNVINNYGYGGTSGSTPSRQVSQAPVLGNDPYARRDNYFNSFGLGGAVTNTIRHILAGSLVGAPIALLYQAIETFKIAQDEQLKMMQNLEFKPEYRTEDGSIDYGKAQNVVQNVLTKDIRRTASAFGLPYDVMMQVGTIATRRLEDPREIAKFVELVGKIRLIDNEADPTTVIAPGLEAVSASFNLSTYQLDKFANTLAVVTNQTKATTDEILKALMRSGASFANAGDTLDSATAMIAISLQNTGLTGENIGNFYKTILDRLTMPANIAKLRDAGIEVYTERRNPDGTITNERKTASELLQSVGNAMRNSADSTEDELSKAVAGGFQISKLRATMKSMMEGLDGVVGDKEFQDLTVKYADLMRDIEQAKEMDMTQLLAQSAFSPMANIQRAQSNAMFAMEDVFRELTPAITTLTDVIVNLSTGISEHADIVSDMIGMAVESLLGFAAVAAGRYLFGNVGQFQQERAIAQTSMDFIRRADWLGSKVGAQEFRSLFNREGFQNQWRTQNNIEKLVRNETVAPYLQNIAALSGRDTARFKQYLERSSTTVKNLPDLFTAFQMWQNDTERTFKSAAEKIAATKPNLDKLVGDPKMQAVVSPKFADNLRNANVAKLAASSPVGQKAVDVLAAMRPEQLAKLQDHLKQVSDASGKPLGNFRQLAAEVVAFADAERKAAESAIRTSPEMKKLTQEVANLSRSMSAGESAVKRFQSAMQGLPAAAKGTLGALRNIAAEMGGMVRSMVLFQAIGATMTSMNSELSLTEGQKAVQHVENQKEFVQKAVNSVTGDFVTRAWSGASMLLGSLLPGERWSFRTANEAYLKMEQAIDALAKDRGLNPDAYDTNNVEKFLRDSGYTKEDLIAAMYEVKGGDGTSQYDSINQALQKAYKTKLEEELSRGLSQEEAEARAMAEEEALKKQLGWRPKAGDVLTRSRDDEFAYLDSQKEKVEWRMRGEQLRAILDGMKTNSEAYLRLRAKEAAEIAKIYQEELDNINAIVENIRRRIQSNSVYDADKSFEENLRSIESSSENTPEMLEAQRLARELKAQQDLAKDVQVEADEAKVEERRRNWEASTKPIDDALARIARGYTGRVSDLGISMDRQSAAYAEAQIAEQQLHILQLQEQLARLRETNDADDVDGEKEAKLQDLENQIKAEQERLKDLGLDRIRAISNEADRRINRNNIEGEINLIQKYLRGMAKDSVEYIQAQRELLTKNLTILRGEIARLKALELTGEEARERDDKVLEYERQAAAAQEQIRESYAREVDIRINRRRKELEDANTDRDISYMDTKLRTGILDDQSPLLRRLRLNDMNAQVADIAQKIAMARTEMGKWSDQPDSEEYRKYQDEIRALTKQQLEVQLGILDEMRAGGGTFNLPDNIKPMTYYEYVTRNNTHRNYTIQGGDTIVQVIVPNVSSLDAAGARRAGEEIATALNNRGVPNLRLQMAGNPMIGYNGLGS